MQIKEYAEKAKRTMVPLPNLKDNVLHMVLGMVTEAGELADVFKKNLAYGKPIDWVNVREEIGDSCWYLINLCTLMEWDLEDILQTNISKLETRYGEKFSEERANERDLLKERGILENAKDK